MNKENRDNRGNIENLDNLDNKEYQGSLTNLKISNKFQIIMQIDLTGLIKKIITETEDLK